MKLMPKLAQLHDGQRVTPVMRGFLIECCDCGLRHRINFAIKRTAAGRTMLSFRAFRLPKKTSKPK